jgi:cytochrome c-type biogenesis protein
MLPVPLMVGAFVAGILMFLAPCTLPIVPGYLAFIGGNQKLVLRNAVGFVIGFSILFILLGASAGLFGVVIGAWRYMLARLSGVLFIVFGLTMMGLFNIPLLSRERHIKLPHVITVGHPTSSMLIGALFALGWSPCIGPILGTVLLVASTSSTAASGALLLAIFSAGLGIPFLLSALLLARVQGFFLKMARAAQVASTVGGAFLVVFGVLVLFDATGLLIEWAYGALNVVGYDKLIHYL